MDQQPCQTPCAALLELKRKNDELIPALILIPRMADKVDAMSLTIRDLESTVKHTQEIIAAWENAKGFVHTVQFISTTIKIFAPIIGVFVAVSYVLKKAGLL